MLSTFIIPIILIVCTCSPASAAEDAFALMREERIGSLRIGLPESEVAKTTDCALQRGPEELWGADGAYHQEWTYAACGLTVGMVSEEKGGKKSIESISLVSPGNLATKQGIRIGSSEQEVMAAYKSFWNKEDSDHFGGFVGGSIYGGLLFDFNNGRVSRIFLGAAAE